MSPEALRSILETHTVKSLKDAVRNAKTKLNYSKLTRSELIDMMVKNHTLFKDMKRYSTSSATKKTDENVLKRTKELVDKLKKTAKSVKTKQDKLKKDILESKKELDNKKARQVEEVEARTAKRKAEKKALERQKKDMDNTNLRLMFEEVAERAAKRKAEKKALERQRKNLFFS